MKRIIEGLGLGRLVSTSLSHRRIVRLVRQIFLTLLGGRTLLTKQALLPDRKLLPEQRLLPLASLRQQGMMELKEMLG